MAKVVILMADYGNDPTETAVPYTIFKDAGFDVTFATENGNTPECDKKMMSGWTGKLLGAPKVAIDQYTTMRTTPAFHTPLSWSSPTFSLSQFSLIFLPGGHDKGMRQIITSAPLHRHLASYVRDTRRGSSSGKAVAAICHGVQVLAAAETAEGSGRSVIHDFETTSLTGVLETAVFWGTRLWLGDYYKTFGYGSENVETIVRNRLDNPEKQYKKSTSMSPWIHEDPNYNYVSGRFPPDAELLANKAVELVKSNTGK